MESVKLSGLMEALSQLDWQTGPYATADLHPVFMNLVQYFHSTESLDDSYDDLVITGYVSQCYQ